MGVMGTSGPAPLRFWLRDSGCGDTPAFTDHLVGLCNVVLSLAVKPSCKYLFPFTQAADPPSGTVCVPSLFAHLELPFHD